MQTLNWVEVSGLCRIGGGSRCSRVRFDNGFHKGAGTAAAALNVAACTTGFAEYGYFFDPGAGLPKYNIHIVLRTLATAGFVATGVNAEDLPAPIVSRTRDNHKAISVVIGPLLLAELLDLFSLG